MDDKNKGWEVEKNEIIQNKIFWEACSCEIKIIELPCALKK